MPNHRALLTWEYGAGRAHIVTLEHVAAALRAQGVAIAGVCVANTAHTDDLASYAPVTTAPRLQMPQRQVGGKPRRPSGYYGDLLHFLGFADPLALSAAVAAWRQVIIDSAATVVIGDYAPVSLLAARSLGVAAIATGVGSCTPPIGVPSYPCIAADPQPAPGHPEAEMCSVVNGVMADYGVPPVACLPDIFAHATPLVRGLQLLDPYAAWRSAPSLPPPVRNFEVSATRGDEVFVYLSNRDRDNAVTLTALMALGLPVRALVLGISPERRAMLQSRGVVVVDGPRPPAEIARTTRVLVHAGNHGTATIGLRAGIPQVCLPQHAEHMGTANALQQAGVARIITRRDQSVPYLHERIHDAYHDTEGHSRAMAMAPIVATEMRDDPISDLRAALVQALNA